MVFLRQTIDFGWFGRAVLCQPFRTLLVMQSSNEETNSESSVASDSHVVTASPLRSHRLR